MVIVLAVCLFLLYRIIRRQGPTWAARCPPIPRAQSTVPEEEDSISTSVMRSTRIDQPHSKREIAKGVDLGKGVSKLSSCEQQGSKMVGGGGGSKMAKAAAKASLPKAPAKAAIVKMAKKG